MDVNNNTTDLQREAIRVFPKGSVFIVGLLFGPLASGLAAYGQLKALGNKNDGKVLLGISILVAIFILSIWLNTDLISNINTYHAITDWLFYDPLLYTLCITLPLLVWTERIIRRSELQNNISGEYRNPIDMAKPILFGFLMLVIPGIIFLTYCYYINPLCPTGEIFIGSYCANEKGWENIIDEYKNLNPQ